MLEFPLGDFETVRCETSGAGGDWWACSFNVVLDLVLCGGGGVSGVQT